MFKVGAPEQEFVWTLRSDLQGFKSMQGVFADKMGSAGSSICTDACRGLECRGKTLMSLDELVDAFGEALEGKTRAAPPLPQPSYESPKIIDAVRLLDSRRIVESRAIEQPRAASVQLLATAMSPHEQPRAASVQLLATAMSPQRRENWGEVERKADSASVTC